MSSFNISPSPLPSLYPQPNMALLGASSASTPSAAYGLPTPPTHSSLSSSGGESEPAGCSSEEIWDLDSNTVRRYSLAENGGGGGGGGGGGSAVLGPADGASEEHHASGRAAVATSFANYHNQNIQSKLSPVWNNANSTTSLYENHHHHLLHQQHNPDGFPSAPPPPPPPSHPSVVPRSPSLSANNTVSSPPHLEASPAEHKWASPYKGGEMEVKKPKSYQCSACDKWFTSSGHLKRHFNTTLHKNAIRHKTALHSHNSIKPASDVGVGVGSSVGGLSAPLALAQRGCNSSPGPTASTASAAAFVNASNRSSMYSPLSSVAGAGAQAFGSAVADDVSAHSASSLVLGAGVSSDHHSHSISKFNNGPSTTSSSSSPSHSLQPQHHHLHPHSRASTLVVSRPHAPLQCVTSANNVPNSSSGTSTLQSSQALAQPQQVQLEQQLQQQRHRQGSPHVQQRAYDSSGAGRCDEQMLNHTGTNAQSVDKVSDPYLVNQHLQPRAPSTPTLPASSSASLPSSPGEGPLRPLGNRISPSLQLEHPPQALNSAHRYQRVVAAPPATLSAEMSGSRTTINNNGFDPTLPPLPSMQQYTHHHHQTVSNAHGGGDGGGNGGTVGGGFTHDGSAPYQNPLSIQTQGYCSPHDQLYGLHYHPNSYSSYASADGRGVGSGPVGFQSASPRDVDPDDVGGGGGGRGGSLYASHHPVTDGSQQQQQQQQHGLFSSSGMAVSELSPYPASDKDGLDSCKTETLLDDATGMLITTGAADDKDKAEPASAASTTASAAAEFRCNDCDKAFTRLCYLKQHNKSFHNGEKPYKCGQCGKRFPVEVLYQEHLSKHAGDKPYKCEVCPKQFNHKTDLRRHMCLHTGEKPFTCDVCGKGFIREDRMIKHSDTHKKKQGIQQQQQQQQQHMHA